MHIAKHILFLSILIFVVSGCTTPTESTPKTMTDKIHQSESNYNDAVGDVIDMRDDLDGYDLGI